MPLRASATAAEAERVAAFEGDFEPLPPMRSTEDLRDPARLHAAAFNRVLVQDAHLSTPFSLDAYMRLPLEQYTLPTVKKGKMEFFDGQPGRFRFQVPRLQFFTLWVEPVLDVFLRVPEGSDTVPEVVLRSEGCYIVGCPAFERLKPNEKFNVVFESRVRARTSTRPTFADDADGSVWNATSVRIDAGQGELVARTEITVNVQVEPPFHLIPRNLFVNTCSGVIRGLVNLLLPQFIAQIRDDFGLWATSEAARKVRRDKSVREWVMPATTSRSGSE